MKVHTMMHICTQNTCVLPCSFYIEMLYDSIQTVRSCLCSGSSVNYVLLCIFGIVKFGFGQERPLSVSLIKTTFIRASMQDSLFIICLAKYCIQHAFSWNPFIFEQVTKINSRTVLSVIKCVDIKN